MPVSPTYPGVYVEEIPSGVRTLVGVATSITAFIGRARKGPMNDPIRIQSYADFERVFGGLWIPSTMSYAVHHYFANGGADAIVIRVAASDALEASVEQGTPSVGKWKFEAANVGEWGNSLSLAYDHTTRDPEGDEAALDLFNLFVKDAVSDTVLETFRNLSIKEDHKAYVVKVLEQGSSLIRVKTAESERPDPGSGTLTGGNDGATIGDAEIKGSESGKTGFYALENADLFNLMCLPPPTRTANLKKTTLDAACTYCVKRRAMLIVDPPFAWTDHNVAIASLDGLIEKSANAAVYFPNLVMADPLKEYRLETFAPCGAVAGIMARTDTQRGVWKAPAGMDATLSGVSALTYKMTDGENGQLNPLGLNCLRTFPVIGNVVWGARTSKGADMLASEWKYIPIRRLALYIEESLFRGTQWVVFEPNDEPLWSQIRLNVGAFMHRLFRQGAFQGTMPKEAYFVKCDKETTTQTDRNLGIVNIVVGFAPLKPAEFVIIKIQQIATQD